MAPDTRLDLVADSREQVHRAVSGPRSKGLSRCVVDQEWLTDRLTARAPGATHRDGYRTLFLDSGVDEWLRPAPMKPFRDLDVVDMLNRNEEHWAIHGFGPWALFERDGEELIGRGGLRWTEVDGRLEVELPWTIQSDRWGRGYATEAALAALEWARSRE